jgi:hypothetical protein
MQKVFPQKMHRNLLGPREPEEGLAVGAKERWDEDGKREFTVEDFGRERG